MPTAVQHGFIEGFATTTLSCGDLSATFLPQLNMLCSSLVFRGDELLHLRAGIEAYAARAKTSGIPLLHPWANRLASDRYEIDGHRVVLAETGRALTRDGNGLSNHGLLGGRTEWTIIEERAEADSTTLRAAFDFSPEDLLANFPFPHRLEIEAVVNDDSLLVTTRLTPTSDRRVPVSFGYHPYFRLPHSARETWRLTLPVTSRLKTDARQIPTGEVDASSFDVSPLGDRTFDDCFTDIEAPRTFAIDDGRLRIEVEFSEAYRFAQIYAPPGSDFVCIEPMTAPPNAMISKRDLRFAEPGTTFEASFRIRAIANTTT